MKELLEFIAKSMVDDPGSVQVKETESDAAGGGTPATVLQLSVAKDDMGKVIGRQGRIAKAIRTVVKASAASHNKKVIVDIV